MDTKTPLLFMNAVTVPSTTVEPSIQAPRKVLNTGTVVPLSPPRRTYRGLRTGRYRAIIGWITSNSLFPTSLCQAPAMCQDPPMITVYCCARVILVQEQYTAVGCPRQG